MFYLNFINFIFTNKFLPKLITNQRKVFLIWFVCNDLFDLLKKKKLFHWWFILFFQKIYKLVSISPYYYFFFLFYLQSMFATQRTVTKLIKAHLKANITWESNERKEWKRKGERRGNRGKRSAGEGSRKERKDCEEKSS